MKNMKSGLIKMFVTLFSFLFSKKKVTPQTVNKYIHVEPPERKRSHGVNNNRKRTRSRIIQEIKLNNGRSKFIRHAA